MSKVKLGDVAIEHKETCGGSKDGYPIVGLEHLTPEEVTLTAWDEDSDNTFTKVFRKGNVLFGRRRAYLRKAAVAPFDGICSGDITVIEAIPDRILPELLPFIIQNDGLFSFAVGKSAGSLSPPSYQHIIFVCFSVSSLPLPCQENSSQPSDWGLCCTLLRRCAGHSIPVLCLMPLSLWGSFPQISWAFAGNGREKTRDLPARSSSVCSLFAPFQDAL